MRHNSPLGRALGPTYPIDARILHGDSAALVLSRLALAMQALREQKEKRP